VSLKTNPSLIEDKVLHDAAFVPFSKARGLKALPWRAHLDRALLRFVSLGAKKGHDLQKWSDLMSLQFNFDEVLLIKLLELPHRILDVEEPCGKPP